MQISSEHCQIYTTKRGVANQPDILVIKLQKNQVWSENKTADLETKQHA